MATLDIIKIMKQQGYSNSDVIRSLQEKGISGCRRCLQTVHRSQSLSRKGALRLLQGGAELPQRNPQSH